jgi:hypothetical protein
MPILDTRQGRNFRLFRCTGCDKLEWKEEK